jgi:hypothetical protein
MSEIGGIRKILGDNKKILFLLLPLVILALLFPSAFTGEQVFIGEYHDVLANSMPYLFLGDHPFALWNNAWIGGFPEYASPMSDRYYPFSLPFYLATKDIFILNLVLLLHVYIAFLAFHKLAGLFTRNDSLILVFSLFYSLSGIMLSRIWAGHIFIVYALAWIPLVYCFFFRITLFDGTNVRNIVLFVLSSLLLLLNGAVFYFVYTFLLLGVYFLYFALARALPEKKILALVLAVSLIFLLCSIKIVPGLNLSPLIDRIDPINPIGDGGSLENNIAAFVTGTQIDTVFGWHESRALIGIIPVLFLVLGLVFSERRFAFPSFFALLFAFLWADGGKTLLSFVHLLPVLNSFRNSGRIFGALLPILLVIALQGVLIAYSRLKNHEGFMPDDARKKSILTGVVCLAALKLLELPYQGIPSWQAILSLLIVAAFLVLLYTRRMTGGILLPFLGVALAINLAALALDFPLLQAGSLFAAILSTGIVALAIIITGKEAMPRQKAVLCSILLAALLIAFAANFTCVTTFDPKLEASPAKAVLGAMSDHPSPNIQPWIFENGWPIQHIDFTYWFITNGSHPLRAYYSYFLKTIPGTAYNIGGTTYSVADYFVDTASLENGQRNFPNTSFEAGNVSVFQPGLVLPNAFVLRGNTLLPGRITRFTPDEVILQGDFRQGDTAVLKSAYYPGWKINGEGATSGGNMPAARLGKDTTAIRYEFAPSDFTLGLLLTASGILLLAIVLWKRQAVDDYLAVPSGKEEGKRPGKDEGKSPAKDGRKPRKKQKR